MGDFWITILDLERVELSILINSLSLSLRIRKPAVNQEYLAKENDLITCYNNNPKRILDCWKEVEDLKIAVKKAQTDYVQQFGCAVGAITSH